MNIYLIDPHGTTSMVELQQYFRSTGSKAVNQRFIMPEDGNSEDVVADIDYMSFLDTAIVAFDSRISSGFDNLIKIVKEIKHKLPILFLTRGRFIALNDVFGEALKGREYPVATLNLDSLSAMSRLPSKVVRLTGFFHGNTQLQIPVGELTLDRVQRCFFYPDGSMVPIDGDRFRVLEYLAMRPELPVEVTDLRSYIFGSRVDLASYRNALGSNLHGLRKVDLGDLNMFSEGDGLPRGVLTLSEHHHFADYIKAFLKTKKVAFHEKQSLSFGIWTDKKSNAIFANDLVFHSDVPAIMHGNQIVSLAPREHNLLKCLTAARGGPPNYSKFDLGNVDANTLKEYIKRLRKKMGFYGDVFRSKYGRKTAAGLAYYYIDMDKVKELHEQYPYHSVSRLVGSVQGASSMPLSPGLQ